MISTLVFNIILVIAGVTGGVAIVVPVFLLINRYSHDKYRIIITMYIGLSLSILSLITYIVVYPPSNSHPTNINAVQTGVSDYTGLYIIAIVLIYVIGITVSLMAYRKGKRQYQQQVEDLDKSNERLVQDLSRRVSVDIYGPIQIQLNEMKGYYIFAKRQAIV